MAKRETKESYSSAKQAAGNVAGNYDPMQKASEERAAGIGAGLGEQREEITGGFRNMMQNPADIAARQISAQQVGFNKIADPRATNTGELKGIGEHYKTFRDTGGLSTENVDRMRGMGGFDEFAKTGGYTPESLANIKSQAISPIGSYATGTREELARRNALQGGYAPGFDAANRALQRDTSRAIADTSLNANVMLQDRINQGRQWGIGGIAQSEGQLAGLQSGNKLAAAAGEAGIAKSLADLDAADIDRLMQTGMFNSRGELDAAIANQQATLSADQYNAGAGDRADIYNQQNAQDQYAAGLSGLTGLYGSDVGLQQSEYDRQLAIQNAEEGARSGYLGTQSNLATQPGIGGNLVGLAGAAAGIGAGMMGPKLWKPPTSGYDYTGP